jgi:hypothetical protein
MVVENVLMLFNSVNSKTISKVCNIFNGIDQNGCIVNYFWDMFMGLHLLGGSVKSNIFEMTLCRSMFRNPLGGLRYIYWLSI